MNDRLKDLLAVVERTGCVPLSSITASPFDSDFLGRALEVSPGQSLMHYLSLGRFKTLLTSKTIYMRRLDLFECDPHEGRFPAANATRQSSVTRGFLEQVGLPADAFRERREFIEGTLRQLLYVHCWFGWDDEDEGMWRDYGDNGRGVCIRTTARRLREALRQAPHMTCDLCGVTYSGDDQPVAETISFLAACRKRPQFANEREIRLVGQLDNETWQASCTKDGLVTPEHQMVGVNFERLFERVYVGPNASDETFQEVEALANAAAGCRVVHRSSIVPFPSQRCPSQDPKEETA